MNNNENFVEYYKTSSLTEKSKNRAKGIMHAILRFRERNGRSCKNLMVADIGCNSGTQSRCWLEQGHIVYGIDISRKLIEIAKERNKEFEEYCKFEVCSATDLPWHKDLFDVCIIPELLEHIQDWKRCLEESTRILKPGGTLFLSTTNILCPKQQEFDLPVYSWYPNQLKKYFVKKSLTSSPELVNHTSYPAINWFNPFSLKRFLSEHGFETYDRFDLIDSAKLQSKQKIAVGLIRRVAVLKYIAHVLTPYTIIIGSKTTLTPEL